MIRSFADKQTERLFMRETVRTLDPQIQRNALIKLWLLDAADTLQDLRIPPGNHLEALHGDRTGQHSIRINKKWRICFTWTKAGLTEVEITDYH